METPKENILKWFTGKKLEKAEIALSMVIDSQKNGSWIPKASRFARSAFKKPNVAIKLTTKFSDIEKLALNKETYHCAGWDVTHCMRFGLFEQMQKIDFKILYAAANEEQTGQLKKAEQYKNDFAELSKIMWELDNTRPKPVITFLNVSPTITYTMVDMKLNLNLDTIRVCPFEWYKVEIEKNRWEMHTRLLWPKGTQHNKSFFASNFTHCHACGHAIKNVNNWVPILIDSKDGVPHSMWLGHDCAESVFGIRVKGKITIEDGKK